jgi:hypothetical protein
MFRSGTSSTIYKIQIEKWEGCANRRNDIIRKAYPLTTMSDVFGEGHALCPLKISFVDFENE